MKSQSSKFKAQNSKFKVQNDNLKRKNELKYRSYYFSIDIIKFVNRLPQQNVSKIIIDQLVRSTTSIGANIIEAKSSSSRKDFIRFYEIALKSANESKYWLSLMRDALNIEEKHIKRLLDEVEEISNMLGSSIITLKNKKF